MGRASVMEAISYCMQREHLARTVRIALVVGVVLNAINASGSLARGDFGAATWLRIAGNFVVPFVVSNLGLLSGRAR